MNTAESTAKTVEVPCCLEGIAEAEPLLQQWVSQYFNDPARIYFVTLSVIEVLTNVVEHGYNGVPHPDEVVIISFTSTAERLLINLIDKAALLPAATIEHLTSGHSEMPAPDQELDALPVSGWGLNIITSTASSVSYTRQFDKNLLTLEFDSCVPAPGYATKL